MSDRTLQVAELFKSIQGEGTRAGLPCCFVRTAGCNLECSYCDTRYAAESRGTELPLEDIIERVADMGPELACVTGGEPLLHRAVPELCGRLLQRGMTVVVETNGSEDISVLPEGVIRVMDVKCPGSGEADSLLRGNLDLLGLEDEVKFVLTDRDDYEWARVLVEEEHLTDRGAVLFSPAYGRLEARRLADWLLEWNAPVRLQLQLHRLLWPERNRSV
ncbi:MAG: radical SAM protein [Planctomycetota bacterium]